MMLVMSIATVCTGHVLPVPGPSLGRCRQQHLLYQEVCLVVMWMSMSHGARAMPQRHYDEALYGTPWEGAITMKCGI